MLNLNLVENFQIEYHCSIEITNLNSTFFERRRTEEDQNNQGEGKIKGESKRELLS